jgi:hypothetical protein
VILTVSGQVEKFASISPKRVRLMGYVGQPLKTIVNIIPKKKYPFKIIGTQASDQKNIRYTLEETQDLQGTGYILSVENVRKEQGNYYALISLKTDSKIKPLIQISIYGNILEPKQTEKK